jgi:hypothetical protein
LCRQRGAAAGMPPVALRHAGAIIVLRHNTPILFLITASLISLHFITSYRHRSYHNVSTLRRYHEIVESPRSYFIIADTR